MKILNGVNNDFSNNVEDFFYEIYTKIKFVDEFNFGDKLKDQICFIDLPGFGTNNNFETKDIYSKLMKSCHLFLFVFRNLIIKETSNKIMISKLFKTLIEYYSKTTAKSFINKCFFIINFKNNQNISEKYVKEAKEDISTIYRNLNINDINVSFFNARFYDNYLKKLNPYEVPEKLIKKEIKLYNNLRENFFLGLNENFNKKTFIEQFKNKLTEDVENISKEEEKMLKVSIKNIIDKKTENNIHEEDINFITKYILKKKEKEIIKNSSPLLESNYKNYSKELHKFILKGNEKREKQIINDLKEPFNNLDNIFNVSFVSKKGKLEEKPNLITQKPLIGGILEQFKDDVNKYLQSINKEFKSDKNTYNNIIQLLNDSLEDLRKALNEKKKCIEEPKLNKKDKENIFQNIKSYWSLNLSWLYSNNWKKIEDQFEMCFSQNTKVLKDKLINNINTYSDNIIKYYDECFNLFEGIEKDFELQNLFPTEHEKIVNFKDYFSSKINNYSSKKINEIIQEIIDDIIEGAKECTNYDKSKTVMDWIYAKTNNSNYLYKIIDYMIENSTKKFNEFIRYIDQIITDYHTLIVDSIKIKEYKIIDALEKLKEEEEDYINYTKMKNEKERKEWEEKKSLYEKEKKEWEDICKEYRQIRNEMYKNINIIK